MNSIRSTATNSICRLLCLVGLSLVALFLAGCDATITRTPLSGLGTATEPHNRSPQGESSRPAAEPETGVASEGASADDPATAVVQTALPGSRPAFTSTPTSIPGGIRPEEAQSFWKADLDPDLPVDKRPPPVPVPHAIHPDDHYWLARPIASDRRNYDLTWYHYSNRPMLLSALPYRVHHGLDFPNETGTPIFAASSGTVIWAGPLPSSRDGVNYYGNTVVIKHDWLWLGQDVYTLYAHTLELFVEVGDYVEMGQLIAGVGASGEVSGPHLHLEVRVGENNYHSTRNPALWLAPYEGWGTLAGRFMDQRGRLIHGALVTIYPVEILNDFEVPIQRQRTYEPSSTNSDEVWQENFVVADLPAGEYLVVVTTAGATFRRTVYIRPGQTNYIIIQADFNWVPTETPTLTPTITPTPIGTPTAVE